MFYDNAYTVHEPHMFFDWIPKLANADLGIIGTISTAIAIVSIFAYKITKRKHR